MAQRKPETLDYAEPPPPQPDASVPWWRYVLDVVIAVVAFSLFVVVVAVLAGWWESLRR
jgi:hypothetical protein